MHRIGFNRDTYIRLQSEHIAQRRAQFGGKLYLEFGGKLVDDMHASRVLPGFTPDNKIVMLKELADEVEIIVAVNAKDFARRKVRADMGTTYDDEVLRQIDEFRERGLFVGSVVITQWTDDNKAAHEVKSRFEKLGITVYRHFPIPGYPSDVSRIVSEQGYGANEYIRTSRDLVVVTAPGPGSGKMATCLSQLYHDHKRGIESGYAKWETFPIWNLPLDHPVNIAYEAATADLDDVNMIDPFHLEAYGVKTVNYNRDVEIFPVLNRLFERILGSSPYKSPTDMGVNMAGMSICDDGACREASEQEVIRRYYKALVAEKKQGGEPVQSARIGLLMGRLGLERADRPVVRPALELAESTGAPAAAIELEDGRIVLGKTSPLLGCSSAMLLNALKLLAGIDPDVKLLARESIEPIQRLKTADLGSRNPRLHTDEVLIALAVSANGDENARLALAQLGALRGCDVHESVILGSVDEGIFRALGIQVTSEPVYATKSLYRKK
ncbi:ATP-dependent Zn protease [Actinomyces sp. oral taxon 178 str. F0338]|nr:ATP-dependent Zn protease [Actinomyces sp. oral taxon 178 str. F0338]